MECSLVHWYEVKTDEGKLANTVVLGRVKRFQAVSPAQKPAHWLGA
jgi:flavin reductase (DIM6/NTAB) family NADH-FMN oxidoreductase RutF